MLATILVGEDPASVTYVRMKGNACERVGIKSLKVELPGETTTEELVANIRELNDNPDVTGILLQHPVPSHIDEQKCFNTISLEKDVDGVNTWCFRQHGHAAGLFCQRNASGNHVHYQTLSNRGGRQRSCGCGKEPYFGQACCHAATE